MNLRQNITHRQLTKMMGIILLLLSVLSFALGQLLVLATCDTANWIGCANGGYFVIFFALPLFSVGLVTLLVVRFINNDLVFKILNCVLVAVFLGFFILFLNS